MLAEIHDDAAVNGCRPEYVTAQGPALLATADYGDVQPAVRLYDPRRFGGSRAFLGTECLRGHDSLRAVQSESVLGRIDRRAHLRAERGRRIGLEARHLQPGESGRRHRLEKARVRTLVFQPHSELEGWLRQPDGRELFVTSSPKQSLRRQEQAGAAVFDACGDLRVLPIVHSASNSLCNSTMGRAKTPGLIG